MTKPKTVFLVGNPKVRELVERFVADMHKDFAEAAVMDVEAALLGNCDVHRQRAAALFNVPEAEVTDQQRRDAKTVFFGIDCKTVGAPLLMLPNRSTLTPQAAAYYAHLLVKAKPKRRKRKKR